MRHLRSLNVLYVPKTGALKLLACRSHAALEVPKCAPCPEDRALKLLACRSHAALEVPKWFSMSRRQGLSNCWPAGHMRHLRSLNVLYVPKTWALKLLACRSHAALEVPKCALCPEDRALKLLACRSHAALEVPKWFSMSRRQGRSNCWPAGHMRHLRSLNVLYVPKTGALKLLACRPHAALEVPKWFSMSRRQGSQTAGLQVTCGTWGP